MIVCQSMQNRLLLVVLKNGRTHVFQQVAGKDKVGELLVGAIKQSCGKYIGKTYRSI